MDFLKSSSKCLVAIKDLYLLQWYIVYIFVSTKFTIFQRLRRFRNKLIHETDKISDEEVNNELKSLEEILKKI